MVSVSPFREPTPDCTTVPTPMLINAASAAVVLGTGTDAAWLIQLPQAAQLLRVSTRRVQALVASNAVPFRRIGRQLRFEPAELRAWIACGCPVEPGSAVRVRKAIGKGGAQ